MGPNKNKGLEFGYATGVYYNCLRKLAPGLEFYGGIGLIDDNDPLQQQQHYDFSTLRGESQGGLEYSLGSGLGLTRRSDQVLLKLNLEFEHCIGAIF